MSTCCQVLRKRSEAQCASLGDNNSRADKKVSRRLARGRALGRESGKGPAVRYGTLLTPYIYGVTLEAKGPRQ